MNKNQKGFTLVEVGIVIAIISILVSTFISSYNNMKRKPDLENSNITTVVEKYSDIEWSHKLRIVCLEGFEYYFSNQSIFAPRFDLKDRLPKLCDVEKKP